jgi:zinc/manganese transport system substrate-binding protein
MKHRFLALALSLLVLLVPGAASAALRVVATVPTLAALARDLGGSHVEVRSLALPTQDPHFVDAKPSLALELNKADLLLIVGLGMETGWLPVLQTGARNAEIQVGGNGYLDCSSFARLLEKPQNVDRSEGDIHPGGNPHYLYDPRQIEHVAIGVASRLSELDPDHAGDYKKQLKSFLKKLHKLRHALQERTEAHRGAGVVAYHKSWVYLTDWLGLEQVAFLEPKPGIPPNPAHVAKVLATARKRGAKLVIQESYYPSSTAKLVAEKIGAKLVVLPGGVDFEGGETVLEHIAEMTERLLKGLGG